MTKNYKSICIATLLMGLFALNSFAQREVPVASVANGGVVDGLPLTIKADAEARTAALPQLTAYVLEPGGIYPIISIMEPDFYLHIKSSSTDPTAAKPRLVAAPTEAGGFNDFIEFRSPLGGKLENLHISGQRGEYDGVAIDANRHNIKLYAGARVEIIGCEIAHDVPGAAISIWEDGSSLFLEDCMIHSIGHHRSLGGNGRVVSPRANMDTLSLVNCSFFNFTDRIFRNMGAEIQYTKVDHCTGVNSGGWHGGMQLGKTHEVVVTNNVFGNMITFGSAVNRVAGGTTNEQTQPEDGQMYVITLDTIYADSKITVRNNNMYWEQQYKDLWAANSSTTSAPGTITATISGALENPDKAVMEELLTFAVAPPTFYDFTLAGMTTPDATTFPENFYFGNDVDLSYGTTVASYTAADKGYPLGDLNQYPELKTKWDNGESLIEVVEPRIVNVKSMANGGVVDGLPLAIIADSEARTAALPQLTTYVLEPGGIYPIISIMEPNFYLHIKSSSSDLSAEKPRLVAAPTEAGGFNDFIEFRSPLGGKLENLNISGQRGAYDGVAIDANRHNIKLYAGARVEIVGCEIAHDVPGAAISIWEDGSSLFLEDCMIHSIGHHRSLGGNGRVVSPRANMDTLSLVNCSFFNFTDRIFRNMGAEIQYTKVDHCTGVNSGGWHGGMQLGKTHEVVITNNVFGNMITFGSAVNRVAGGTTNEQTQPEDGQMYVITLDTIYADSKITVRNNNMYWDQQYKDLWAANSSTTSAPGTITATISGALDNPAKAVMEELLTFAVAPPTFYDFTLAGMTTPDATTFPENFYFGNDVDLSYGTTVASYTAADKGYPLGDLNQYPELKTKWENGEVITSVGDLFHNSGLGIDLRSYPNPITSQATLQFSLKQASPVTIEILDITGKVAQRIDAGTFAPGMNSFVIMKENMPNGIYLLKLNANTESGFTKILVK